MVDVSGSVHHLQTVETFVCESFSLLIAGSPEFTGAVGSWLKFSLVCFQCDHGL